ncbi:MAG: hypothetical protein DCC65_07880 [Planctomycetota bacterium]|nr:MAG: hypothetical protein DCC65_07880 [Planctomycetota bacterium]
MFFPIGLDRTESTHQSNIVHMLAGLLTRFKKKLISEHRACYRGPMEKESTASRICRAIIGEPLAPGSWHLKLQLAATGLAIGILIGLWSL